MRDFASVSGSFHRFTSSLPRLSMPEVRRYLIGKECTVESHEELIRYLGKNPKQFPTRDVHGRKGMKGF